MHLASNLKHFTVYTAFQIGGSLELRACGAHQKYPTGAREGVREGHSSRAGVRRGPRHPFPAPQVPTLFAIRESPPGPETPQKPP